MSTTSDIITVKLKYKIDSDANLNRLSQSSCIGEALGLTLDAFTSEIEVEFEIDSVWGFMRPISLNGHKIDA